jgi:hypothetical protein
MFAPITQEPRARGAKTLNNSKCQDWEKLYRAALLEQLKAAPAPEVLPTLQPAAVPPPK